MLQFNLDIIFVHSSCMGQGFSDFNELRDTVAGCPGAADPVLCMGEMGINEMAMKRIFYIRPAPIWPRRPVY